MSQSVDSLRSRLALPPEAVEFGHLSLFLVGSTLALALSYWVDLRISGEFAIDVFLSPLFFGLVLPALAYATYRGVDAPAIFSWPTRLGATVTSVFLPSIAVFALSTVLAVSSTASLATLTSHVYSPDSSVQHVFRLWSPYLLSVGISHGVLVALAFELLRSRTGLDTAHAISFTTLLATYFHIALRDAAFTIVTFNKPWRLATFLLLLLSTLAAGVTLGVVYRGVVERSLEVVYRPALVPAFALALLVGVVFVESFAGGLRDVDNVLWAFALGSASYGYARTGSVWVPSAAITGFELSLYVVFYFEMAVF